MADGLRIGELLPTVQKNFTEEELERFLRVGSIEFLFGVFHEFMTLTDTETIEGQLLFLMDVKMDLKAILRLCIP